MTLDLHGYTIHDAWKEYCRVTQDQYWKEKKYIIVITGMGAMNMQFHHWVSNDQYASRYEKLNDGAWKVYIKKKPPSQKKLTTTIPDLSALVAKYNK